ncbi:hypothetical protein FF38_09035 [Lucilia cuprina]|uniref:Uncharacterized protein n=1 Tax=Lucilia cuprina TaxID=7375 RepID=A0A0L0BSE8_LUCCU|nr:hypothetical protein FF38_09035 [Lucilia cuprina]
MSLFYWKNRNNIYIDHGILYLNERIIIPQNQRQLIHSYIRPTYSLTSNWPQINRDIENIINKCKTCQKTPLWQH